MRTRNGKLVGRTFVSNILSNPFYYGHFRYAGEVHEGKHEAIISKKLFDDANAVLKRRYKWSPFVHLCRVEGQMDEPEKVFGGAMRRAFEGASQLARTVPKMDFDR